MKAKTTRRALLMSALSLLLCMSMLVGTTFAWFTDSASSANNIIQSGNLDIELEYWDGDSYEKVTDQVKLFDDAALWEPGHVEVAYLKISNNGSLALKYQLNVNVFEETAGKTMAGADLKLSEHLVFGVVDKEIASDADLYSREEAMMAAGDVKGLKTYNGATKSLEENGDADYVALIIYMPTTVGNEANHNGINLPSIVMGVNVLATQFTYEEDSFDNQYDKDAEYAVSVGTVDELTDAIANGGKIVLTENVALTSAIAVPAGKSVELDLNGKTITAPAGALWAIQNQGTLTLTGNGTIEGSYTALYSNGNLTIEDGTFTATDGFGVLIDNIYGTDASVAVINGGTFTGIGIYNPTDITINGGTFNVGRDPDGATDHLSDEMTLFVNPTFVGAPNTAKVVLNGGTFNGDVYVYDDGITETVFVNNGATITGDVLDNG